MLPHAADAHARVAAAADVQDVLLTSAVLVVSAVGAHAVSMISSAFCLVFAVGNKYCVQ